jgi:hypothetical protein
MGPRADLDVMALLGIESLGCLALTIVAVLASCIPVAPTLSLGHPSNARFTSVS